MPGINRSFDGVAKKPASVHLKDAWADTRMAGFDPGSYWRGPRLNGAALSPPHGGPQWRTSEPPGPVSSRALGADRSAPSMTMVTLGAIGVPSAFVYLCATAASLGCT